jgi:two-component system, sensor histidine kinase PdtaS
MAARLASQSREIAENLGMAIVASSMAPLLLLDGGFRVLAASTSFCRAFRIVAARAVGQPVFDLGDDEWDVPQLRSLLRATLSGDAEIEAYEMDLDGRGRGPLRLVLNAHRLDYGVGDAPRILLTIADVTEARLDQARHEAALMEKEELLRQKAMLLQEVRHRVANSLQIIASVLLQNARRVSSEESRGHLRDAHQRVMSVAALQRQLAASSLEGVPLRPYLTHLCESIAASMIRDPKRISLTVDADETVVESDVSISLGLIVTELVINALKHAFPRDRGGAIRVVYRADGDDWLLSVTDDGVGMPSTPKAVAGLGTSIVEALARQLKAVASVEDRRPGAAASVIHKHVQGAIAPQMAAI